MGLFDKIKHGLEGSGVHTRIDGPSVVAADQASVDITVTFEAKEAPVVLEGYAVHISREIEMNQNMGMGAGLGGGFGMGDGMGNNNNWNMNGNQGPQTVDAGQSVVGDGTPISLQPGTPVSINVQVPLAGLGMAGQVMSQQGGFFGGLERMAEQENAYSQQTEYYIHIKAPVQGTGHHAHASHRIEVAMPGGFRL